MPLKKTPVRTARYASGSGLWISKVTEADGNVSEPEMVARHTLHIPGQSHLIDIGWPQYQFRMVRNYNEGAGTSGPTHFCLFHGHRIQDIIIASIDMTGDATAFSDSLKVYLDVAPVTEFATALAAVSVPDPDPGASPIEAVTTVVSIPTAADKLGVQLFARSSVVGVPAPAVPAITGTALGFSGSQLTDWQWKGFAAYRDESDSDLIRVMAGLEKTGEARSQIGDQSKTANYTFTMRESDGALVSGADLVATDIPFIPHQMVRGRPTSVTGGNKVLTFWCIGRSDPEFVNRKLDDLTRIPTAPTTNGISSAGGIGVWASQDPELKEWYRMNVPPVGVGHMGSQNLDADSVEHVEGPRDLGIMYQPVFQRLTPLTIDTDSGQDPVEEMGSVVQVGVIPD